ncbi:MAG: hypothetical protein IJA69_02250, partial [Clostridia bacterium]|nr:hypothetical protein [Clostridia bacterium]
MSESTTITQIQTHIEELEKRIKSLSVALGANSQLQAVKSILEEIKELLEAYSAELVELSDSTEELQSSTKQNIESVNSKLAELESAVTNIKVKVDEIEATGGAGGGNSGKETTNWYAHKYIPMCVYGHGLITCPHIILYCEPTEKVKIKVRVRGTAASYSQYTKHEFYLNDVLVQSRAYTYVKDVDTVEEFEFYPTKSVNLIEFGSFIGVKNSQTKELCVIYDMDFEFYGRNVTVLNRNHDLKVFTYNNKTYVTRHHAEEGMEFLIYDPSTIDLSLEGQPITKEEESSYWGFHEMLVPQTAKTSGQNTAYIPDENMFYVYKVSKNNGTEMGLIDISAETPT